MGVWTCARPGCRAMTGGSFAKTSLRIARKSRIDDFCNHISGSSMTHVVSVASHPNTWATQRGRDGKPAPVGQRVGPAAPPSSRSASRMPAGLLGGMRAEPISRWGSDMLCHGKGQVSCPTDGGGAPRRRWEKLCLRSAGLDCCDSLGSTARIKRTVDIGARREGRIL